MAKKTKEKMTREAVIESIQPLKAETKLKAWMMQKDDKFYHIASYGGVYRILPQTAIWECNKRGKRLTTESIFSVSGQNHLKCANAFLDFLEELDIEKSFQEENDTSVEV